MSPLLSDVGALSAAAAVVTLVFLLLTRLTWRRGKKLEEP